MFLVSIIKLCIPSFERKMTVKELLNAVLGSNHLDRVFSVLEPKRFPVFRSRRNCSVVVNVFVICSLRANFTSL